MTQNLSNEQQAKFLSTKAAVEHKEGNLDEAIALYLESIEIDENQPSWLYGNLITLLAQSGQLELGSELGRKALAIHHESDEIYRAFGLILAKQDRLEASLDYYAKSVALNQNQPDWVYSYLIEHLSTKGELVQALDLGLQGLAVNPKSAWIYYHLANSQAALERWSEAIENYENARKLEANLPSIQAKIDIAAKQASLANRENNILKYLELVKQNPYDINAYYKLLYENYQNVSIFLKLAFLLLEQNSFNNAIQYFQKAIALNAELVNAYLDCPEVFANQFDVAQSLKLLQKVELPPPSEYITNRNHSNWLFAQYQQQITAYQQLLEFYPHEVELYLELANVYTRQNRFNRALALAKRAVRANPHNHDLAITIKQIKNLQDKFYHRSQQISAVDSSYQDWLLDRSLTKEQIDWIPEDIDTLGYKPLISLLLIVTDASQQYLTETIESLRLQIYPYWECLISYDSESSIAATIAECVATDSRVKPIARQEITNPAEVLNLALAEATGDFIALIQQGDLLTIDALYEVVELLNRTPSADTIYTDEDKVDQMGQHLEPYFKPDWSPDSFLSRMYTGSLGIYRRSLAAELGGFSTRHLQALDYDFVLRLSEQTQNILHLPKILYHQRQKDTDGERRSAEKAALEAALKRRNVTATVIPHHEIEGVYSIRYKINDFKLVSIIIPAKNQSEILGRCLESIFTKTSYPNYEVIVVDNGSTEPEFNLVIAKWRKKEANRFDCHRLDIPFNYSKLNNFGVSKAQGEYLLFLNNDTEVISQDWLEAMVEQSQRDSIGAVGAMLLYQDRTVQHGGVVLGIKGIAGHSHKYYRYGEPGYFSRLISINNYSAVTAACMMCRRTVYQQVEGFDEILSVAFNDVDFCLKIKQKGYHNVWLPHVVLYHYESKSRGDDSTPKKQQRFNREVVAMEARWKRQIELDPCYNPNLTKSQEDYSFARF